MVLITTNYLDGLGNVTIDTCRIYQTTCDDEHFINIISENRNLLVGEFVDTHQLFVLMDNVNVEDTANFYSSISFRPRKRGTDMIYQVCLVTKENDISIDLLRAFLLKLFDTLSLDDSIRIAFSSNPLEATYSISNTDNINLCVDNIFRTFGLNNNELPNQ